MVSLKLIGRNKKNLINFDAQKNIFDINMKRISLIVLLICKTIINTDAQTPVDFVKQVIEKTKNIKTLKFDLTQYERIGNKTTKQVGSFKMQTKPLKVYSKQSFPMKDQEYLFIDGANSGEVLVNPAKFPYIDLNIDPLGDLAHAEQHHTVYDAGYNKLVDVLEFLMHKYLTKIDGLITDAGAATFNGIACKKIILDNTFFKIIDYKVQKNETVVSIAWKLEINEYMIVELNNLSSFGSLKEGQIIKIPNDYASRMELLVDIKRMIPLEAKIYDKNGLYEQFEYTNVVVAPPFATNEFTKKFKEYKF